MCSCGKHPIGVLGPLGDSQNLTLHANLTLLPSLLYSLAAASFPTHLPFSKTGKSLLPNSLHVFYKIFSPITYLSSGIVAIMQMWIHYYGTVFQSIYPNGDKALRHFILTFALAYPNLIVMFLSSSFLNLTVCNGNKCQHCIAHLILKLINIYHLSQSLLCTQLHIFD